MAMGIGCLCTIKPTRIVAHIHSHTPSTRIPTVHVPARHVTCCNLSQWHLPNVTQQTQSLMTVRNMDCYEIPTPTEQLNFLYVLSNVIDLFNDALLIASISARLSVVITMRYCSNVSFSCHRCVFALSVKILLLLLWIVTSWRSCLCHRRNII
jgi:hypothetical protein